MSGGFAHVVLVGRGVAHLDTAYTYRVPDTETVHVGSLVRVPVRGRSREGVVVEMLAGADVPRVQPIRAILGPGLTPDIVHLCHSVAAHYLSSLGEALAAALPPRIAAEEDAREVEPARPPPRLDLDWAREYAGGAQMVGALGAHAYRAFAWSPGAGAHRGQAISSLAAHAVRNGKGVLILVPEVRVRSSVAAALHAQLRDSVAWLGSDRPARERYRSWLALRRGSRVIAAGGRGAVFAPVQNLGLVIVDDESHVSFKEKRVPRFHARPVAAERARDAGATFIAVGVPASAEVTHAIERKIMQGVVPTGARQNPAVVVVDRSKAEDRLVPSAKTLAALRRSLDAGRRVVILVHRKGDDARRIAARSERVLGIKAIRLDARAMKDPDSFERAVNEERLLVSTPVIAKDLELDNIGCVAITEADAALAVPEFRSSEEALATWRRVGRWLGHSDVLVIETAQPRHPAVAALVRWNPRVWWQAEATRRSELGYPPYAALVRIDTTPERGRAVADQVRAAAPGADVLGPVEEEGRSVVVARHRDRAALLEALAGPAARWRSEGVDVRVDVDPREVLR